MLDTNLHNTFLPTTTEFDVKLGKCQTAVNKFITELLSKRPYHFHVITCTDSCYLSITALNIYTSDVCITYWELIPHFCFGAKKYGRFAWKKSIFYVQKDHKSS